MPDSMEEMNQDLLSQSGFLLMPESDRFRPMGQCWKMSPSIGRGHFWTYGEQALFDIKIHDFCFHEDFPIDFTIPGYLSITYYSSVSGEQLTPYRRLSAGCIQCFMGDDTPYKILMHKNIPIRSVGIGISPTYYREYLRTKYPAEYVNPYFAFEQFNQEQEFPELVFLLKQIESYHGEGISAKLFYEGKVAEIIALMVERQNTLPKGIKEAKVPLRDMKLIDNAVSYINDHYSREIPLERLAQIACMGITKFKITFKLLYGCTVSHYVQQRRLSHAECLLADTDLTIGQIAKSVGYSTSSHLARIFQQSTGLTPLEYRKMAQEK